MGENGNANAALVTTEWVSERIDDENVVVAEVDENPALYGEGHIRGAVRLHWRDDLQDPVERDLIERAERALVDVRSPQEFSGELIAPPGYEQEGAQRGGHIPTAQSIPWATAVREDGTFKSADELEQLYAAKGVTRDKKVTAYCRIGDGRR